MAKSHGIFKNWSGKSGNIVYSKWSNLQNVRSYVSPVWPGSAAQLSQAEKINLLSSCFGKNDDHFIEVHWKYHKKKNNTPWSSFVSYNLRNINPASPENIIVSDGQLEPVPKISISYQPVSGSLNISWDYSCNVNGSGSDLVSFFVSHGWNHLVDIIDGPVRSYGAWLLSITPGLSSGNINVWCAVRQYFPSAAYYRYITSRSTFRQLTL